MRRKLSLLLFVYGALWALYSTRSASYYVRTLVATGRWYDYQAVYHLSFALFWGSGLFLLLTTYASVRRKLFLALGAALAASALLLTSAALLAGGLYASDETVMLLLMLPFSIGALYVFIEEMVTPGAAIQRGVAFTPRRLTAEEMYERLLNIYLSAWGGSLERARARLEADIEKLVQQGLSREGAVKELYESTTAGAVRRALE
jgi:hypothetical protein